MEDLSVHEAAQRLAERRAPAPDSQVEQPVPEEQPAPESAPVEEQSPVEDSDDVEGEVQGEPDEVEDEVSEEDSAEEQPDSEETAQPLVLEDDAEIQLGDETITVRELREGNLRQEDYTRKTQALRERENALRGQEQAVQAIFDEQEAPLVAAIQQFQNVNWAALAQKDPEQFRALRTQAEATELEYNRLRQRREQTMEQIQAGTQEVKQKAAAEAQATLKRDLPGWNNAMYYSLVDYAAQIGFDREEVLTYTDPAVFKLLHKAKQYDAAKSKPRKPSIPSTPRRNVNPNSPAPGREPNAEATAVARATKQARKSGSVDDALALMKARRALKR